MTTPLQALIIDDSIHMRKLLASALAHLGNVAIAEAKDGAHGLDELQQRRFDLVITAAEMPLLDGTRLLTLIRDDQRHRDVPIIVISGSLGNEDRAHLLAQGASEVLQKPINAHTLLGTIKTLFNI